uniref:(northern house mosquito) hypothetical protein n=1 Tax=Culex pipiens TaxID=7175 RepID=A0A8D8E6E9_CULPI
MFPLAWQALPSQRGHGPSAKMSGKVHQSQPGPEGSDHSTQFAVSHPRRMGRQLEAAAKLGCARCHRKRFRVGPSPARAAPSGPAKARRSDCRLPDGDPVRRGQHHRLGRPGRRVHGPGIVLVRGQGV